MAKIEGIRIRNYRVLRDITLGRLWYMPDTAALTPMTAVIGKNGVGKSSLFDAFGFLADCLKLGVEEACDERGRNGFDRIRSQGSGGPMEFHICYRTEPAAQLITYSLGIDEDEYDRPFVDFEVLCQSPAGNPTTPPRAFLILSNGAGIAWKGHVQGQQMRGGFDLRHLVDRVKAIGPSALAGGGEVELVELQDNRRLGIADLGALKQHPRICAFRDFVEAWHVSDFTPDAARTLPPAGPRRRHRDGPRRPAAAQIQREGLRRTLLRAANVRRHPEGLRLPADAGRSAATALHLYRGAGERP